MDELRELILQQAELLQELAFQSRLAAALSADKAAANALLDGITDVIEKNTEILRTMEGQWPVAI
jgi:hypothetical protein